MKIHVGGVHLKLAKEVHVMTSSKLEKVAENKFTTYVKEKTICMCIKLNVMSVRGFPDRLILCPMGRVYFIEFKRVGEEPKKLQLYIHKLLHSLGFIIYVTDTYEEAVAFHEQFIQAARIPRTGDKVPTKKS